MSPEGRTLADLISMECVDKLMRAAVTAYFALKATNPVVAEELEMAIVLFEGHLLDRLWYCPSCRGYTKAEAIEDERVGWEYRRTCIACRKEHAGVSILDSRTPQEVTG